MSTWTLVLASLGLFVGINVAVLVLILLNRVLRPLREIKRYVDDTLAATRGITRNLDAIDEAARTHELATFLPRALREALS